MRSISSTSGREESIHPNPIIFAPMSTSLNSARFSGDLANSPSMMSTGMATRSSMTPERLPHTCRQTGTGRFPVTSRRASVAVLISAAPVERMGSSIWIIETPASTRSTASRASTRARSRASSPLLRYDGVAIWRAKESVVGPVMIPFTRGDWESAYRVSATVIGPAAGETGPITSLPRIPGIIPVNIPTMSPRTCPSEMISIPAAIWSATAVLTASRNGSRRPEIPLPAATG